MQKTRRRIIKLRRLREIDDGKLNQLAVELGTIEQRLNQLSNQLSQIHREIDDSFNGSGEAVVTRNQTGVWTDHLHRVSLQIAEAIQRGTEEREQMHDRMIQQRAKVRGWDLLLERLEEEVHAADEQTQHQEADDRFLSKQTVN